MYNNFNLTTCPHISTQRCSIIKDVTESEIYAQMESLVADGLTMMHVCVHEESDQVFIRLARSYEGSSPQRQQTDGCAGLDSVVIDYQI